MIRTKSIFLYCMFYWLNFVLQKILQLKIDFLKPILHVWKVVKNDQFCLKKLRNFTISAPKTGWFFKTSIFQAKNHQNFNDFGAEYWNFQTKNNGNNFQLFSVYKFNNFVVQVLQNRTASCSIFCSILHVKNTAPSLNGLFFSLNINF